jgi:hypothetical protein
MTTGNDWNFKEETMSDAEIEISQRLAERYWAACQGRFVCAQCNDGRHQRCYGFDCECVHRDPIPKPPPKVQRDRNGLSPEERRAQSGFAFGSSEPLTITAEALKRKE